MKNKINSTLHDKSNLIEASGDGNDAGGRLLKLGLDVDLRNIAVAIPADRTNNLEIVGRKKNIP